LSTLSVILITCNESENIGPCLESVKWADEIVVVDGESADDTVTRASRFTDKVFIRPWLGYSENKNFALRQATGEWVFWLDADERVPESLAAEIRRTIESDPSETGFEVARKAFFLGRWIRHCGWYPGYVLRLFRREGARFDSRKVHEKLVVAGRIGRLASALLHYTDNSLEHYLWKFDRYTTLAASELTSRSRAAAWTGLLFRPWHTFIKMYLFRRGFLDGVPGLMLCLLSAGYVTIKYAKLWEIQRSALTTTGG